MPEVSIILPTYNNGDFLAEAIKSVQQQSFLDWELILVNDGSTDGTDALVSKASAQDPRIVYIKHPAQRGLVASLNEAVQHSQGKYLARLDGDDMWISPTKLQEQLGFFKNYPKVVLLGTWAEVVSDTGNKIYNFQPPVSDREIRKQMLMRNCFMHSSILVSKQAIVAAGGYLPGQKYMEDYSLWLRLGKTQQIANLPKVMLRYRLNNAGITQQNNSAQIKAVLGLIKEHKSNYPGYFLAALKWRLQYLLSRLGFNSLILTIKRLA